MPDYDAVIDVQDTNTSHVQVLQLVGPSVKVLDVGCASGALGRALMEQGCRVSGIEVDEDAARTAAGFYESVVVADLDRSWPGESFEPGAFDVIVLADVLEHLHDPVRVLRAALDLLAPEGRVVLSLPNVAHGSLRLAHLQGRWDLTDTGLLDRTHRHHFNRERVLDLLDEAGLAVEELRGTTADPLAVEVAVDDDLPAHVVEWVREAPDAFVYQFVVSARVRRPEEPVGRRVPLVEAVPADEVRVRDQHTERFEKDARDRLRARDEVRGVHAELVAERERVARLRRRNEDLQERLAARREEAEGLRHQVDSRLGRRVRRRAGRAARRLLGPG